MEVTLLGTGGRAGLPRTGCPCARCATALGTHARLPTALLVDGVLLLDLPRDPVLATARAGRSPHAVRQVLLTRPRTGPLPALSPRLPRAAWGQARAGRELVSPSGHRVRAVAVDRGGTGYAVTAPGGERLLYLPPGAAPTGTRPGANEPFALVLLDLVGRPEALARLRAAGAVAAATDVLAVHLDHDVPPGAELHRRLAAAGARAVPDGTTLTVGDSPRLPVPRRTLLLGGARSGKSAEAERRLAAFPDVVYVATGGAGAGDPEWRARIAEHRGRRPSGWRTVETTDLVPLLARHQGPPLLIDCLTLWLADAMGAAGCWDSTRERRERPHGERGDGERAEGERAEGRGGEAASAALARRVARLVAALRETRRTVVLVSNEVGSGVVPATPAGRLFRDELGRLNAAVAAECEEVTLLVAGAAVPLRGVDRGSP